MEVLRVPIWKACAAILCATAIAAFLSSCGGGEGEGGHGGGHGAPAPAPVAPRGLAIPKAYDEPALQERFALLYSNYHEMYQPLNEGLRIRLEFQSDTNDVVGAYLGLTNNNVQVMTALGTTNFSPDLLTTNTRERIYVEDFAMNHAKHDVEAERARAADPAAGDAAAGTNAPILEQRFAMTEGHGHDLRMGPGKNFKPIDGVLLQKGELVNVLEERDGWIRFQAPSTNGSIVSAWVNKFATLPLKDSDAAVQEADIKMLQDEGIVVEFIASNNVARVNLELWNELDYLVRQGVGRSLAFYCGAKRGTGLNWVEFRDSRSGKRVAKYSESQGLKIYNL